MADEDFPPAPTKTFSRLELAKLSGLAPKTIDKFVREGMPVVRSDVKNAPFKFDLKTVFGWLAEADDSPVDELAVQRERKLRLENTKLEMDAKIRSSEFAPMSEIRAEVAEGVERIRQHFLAIPSRMTSLSDEQRQEVHADMVAAINKFSDHMNEKIGAKNALT